MAGDDRNQREISVHLNPMEVVASSSHNLGKEKHHQLIITVVANNPEVPLHPREWNVPFSSTEAVGLQNELRATTQVLSS